MTVIINGTDNSASTPAVTGTDGDTGMFYPAANTVALSTGGSERMRIDSSGNVGIGTGSTVPKTLTINGGVAAGFTDVLQLSSGSTANDAGPGLTFNNNYGSYATNANWQLGAIRAGAPSAAQNYAGYLSFFTNSNASESSIAERMRIDSNGNLLVGTTTASGGASTYKSSSAGAQPLSLWNSATSGTRYFVSFATETASTDRGYITYNGATVAIAQASDERLKENIVDAPSALPKIAQMQIRSFDFKEDGRHVDYGVIAQELNQVIPSAVFEGADNEDGSINKPWSVGLEPIVPILVKAIQELSAKNDALEARIAALEGAE
jgi:hypothetical protein